MHEAKHGIRTEVLGASLGFRNLIKTLLLPSFRPRVGLIESYLRFYLRICLIESHVIGGVTVHFDCPPSLHKFGLLVILVGAWNLTWYQSRGLGFKSRLSQFNEKLLWSSFHPLVGLIESCVRFYSRVGLIKSNMRFYSRVGLIESNMRGGVTVYVDCPPSFQ